MRFTPAQLRATAHSPADDRATECPSCGAQTDAAGHCDECTCECDECGKRVARAEACTEECVECATCRTKREAEARADVGGLDHGVWLDAQSRRVA